MTLSTTTSVEDALEAAFMAGAIAALRRRADRQLAIAAKHGPGTGEAAVACRVAVALVDLANELDWFGLAGPKVAAGS